MSVAAEGALACFTRLVSLHIHTTALCALRVPREVQLEQSSAAHEVANSF